MISVTILDYLKNAVPWNALQGENAVYILGIVAAFIFMVWYKSRRPAF